MSRPYKKIAEHRAAIKGLTNKGRTKAFVKGFEEAFEWIKDMQKEGMITVTFNF